MKIEANDEHIQTTSNAAHETLALATLLDLKYEGTKIEEAGLTKRENLTEAFMEELVCEFWKTFHESYRHAIPPGIIFLPGDKVSHTGYGWAPKTWMSAHGIDYPNPLDSWNGKTDLVHQMDGSSGLRVKYPGFILHTVGEESRNKILFMNQDSHVTFPADRNLIEWYSMKTADSNHHAPPFVPGIAKDSTQLAILLSRPRPVPSPPEIGLLVEIYQTEKNVIEEDDGKFSRPNLFSCHIIRRIHVWREMQPEYLTGPGRNGQEHTTKPHWGIIGGDLPNSDFCLGEAIPPAQPWLVDGFPRKSKSGATRAVPTIEIPDGTMPEQIAVPSLRSTLMRLVSRGESIASKPTQRKGKLPLPEAQNHKRRTLTYPLRDKSPPGLPRQSTLW